MSVDLQVYIYTKGMQCPRWSEKGSGSRGTLVLGGFEPPRKCWALNWFSARAVRALKSSVPLNFLNDKNCVLCTFQGMSLTPACPTVKSNVAAI